MLASVRIRGGSTYGQLGATNALEHSKGHPLESGSDAVSQPSLVGLGAVVRFDRGLPGHCPSASASRRSGARGDLSAVYANGVSWCRIPSRAGWVR